MIFPNVLSPDYSRGVGTVPSLWFRQFTSDVKLTDLQTCRNFRRIVSNSKPDTRRRE